MDMAGTLMGGAAVALETSVAIYGAQIHYVNAWEVICAHASKIKRNRICWDTDGNWGDFGDSWRLF